VLATRAANTETITMIRRTGTSGRGPEIIIVAAIAWTVALHPRSAGAEPTRSETEKLEQQITGLWLLKTRLAA
jgi:hypothetical protein